MLFVELTTDEKIKKFRVIMLFVGRSRYRGGKNL